MSEKFVNFVNRWAKNPISVLDIPYTVNNGRPPGFSQFVFDWLVHSPPEASLEEDTILEKLSSAERDLKAALESVKQARYKLWMIFKNLQAAAYGLVALSSFQRSMRLSLAALPSRELDS